MGFRLHATLALIAALSSIELSDCRLPDFERMARCGTLDVPENAAKPEGRKLSINVVVIPASGGPALADPIVPLMGGPGEEAGSAAPYFAKQFASLLTHRDLLLVDQRGTGKSAALRCDLSSSDDRAANLRDYLPLRAVKRCEQQVREQADPTQYTYTHFAHDLDQVRRALVESLRAALYRAEGASAVPWMIHEAYKGNWNPIVESILAYASARSPDSDVSFGLFLNITCNDDVAFIREEEIGPATQGTYLGDYRVRQQQAACETWPKVTHAADYRKPVHSSVPTMFVSGAIDPAAPPWYTQHVAPGFENRVEIVEQNQGHTEWNPCVGRLYELFVKSASTRGIDTNCEAVPRPPFKIQ